MTQTVRTVSRTSTRLLYDHMNPDIGFYAHPMRSTVSASTVEDIRTDPTNILAQEEHGPPDSG